MALGGEMEVDHGGVQAAMASRRGGIGYAGY
jgi:hypothetical protein